MVSNRSIGIRSLCLLWQVFLVTLSFWVWMFFWVGEVLEEPGGWQRYALYNEFVLVGVLFGSGRAKREASGAHNEWVRAHRRSMRQACYALFCIVLVVFALKDVSVSRSFFLTFLPWLYGGLFFSNYWLPRRLSQWAFQGDREERVALAGTAEKANQLKPWLERKSVVGLRTVGLVRPREAAGCSEYPVLGNLEEMADILREHSITQLIVLDLSLGSELIGRWTQLCEATAVRMLALHDLNAYFNHTTTIFEDDGVRFIGLREEPLESPMSRLLKRTFDIVFALPVVAVVLPVTTLLVWVLQRMQSPGPVFFCQTRVGMMGRPFKMYKYRTMHVNNGREEQQAAKDDARVYPAGRWLRKMSIDELPQFLNVLLGEMSVVGPRPHMPQHEAIFVRVMSKYLVRNFVQPGITGWAQVNGYRGEIHGEGDIQCRVEADIHYLENWSMSLDCLIVLRTIKDCVFPPRSAY